MVSSFFGQTPAGRVVTVHTGSTYSGYGADRRYPNIQGA